MRPRRATVQVSRLGSECTLVERGTDRTEEDYRRVAGEGMTRTPLQTVARVVRTSTPRGDNHRLGVLEPLLVLAARRPLHVLGECGPVRKSLSSIL